MSNSKNVKVDSAQETQVQTPHHEYKQMSPDDFWRTMTFISTQNQFFVSRMKHIM